MNSLRQIWTAPDAFATSLLLAFVDTYCPIELRGEERVMNTEALNWHPGAILLEVERHFGVSLSQPIYDRLMAAIAIVTTDTFYKSLPDFIHWCNVLAGDSYDPRYWNPAEALEIAWAINEVLLLDPPEEDEPFVPEIVAYIGKALDDEGIVNPPDVLRIAIRSGDIGSQIHATVGDDPAMAQNVYQMENSRTEAINDALRQTLAALTAQLAQLPLQNGSAQEILKSLRGEEK